MENTPDKGLISLKDAAKISGYSADYIGQLIRAGKIPGKQVYCNIAWMTTAKAIREYQKNGSNSKGSITTKAKNRYRLFAMEMNIISLFFKTFKTALPLLTLIIISCIALFIFIVFQFNPVDKIQSINTPNTKIPSLTF